MADCTAFRRILCAIDSGSASGEAVRQAALLAGAQTELSLIALATGDRSVEGSVEEAQAVAAERGIAATVRVARGANPARLLQDASAGADLLVVGGDDDPHSGDVVLGGTASSAVHAGELTVLVARRPPQGRDFPRDILVATDGSADSRRGVELAGRIAGAHDARIALVRVDDGRSGADRALDEDATTLRDEFGEQPTTIEEFGNPAERIAEVAQRERVSLLVLGSRGLGAARTLGSVGERLAHEAPCSVLVARPA